MSVYTTKEGFTYSPEKGLQSGLATEGAIRPLSSFASKSNARPFDVIVIGAGYAGLTAARDLTLAGKSVLLVEGRDRIGGRTWTSQVEGERFEMGGTWIHQTMGYVWREVQRYGLDRRLKYTPNEDFPDYAFNKTVFNGTTLVEPVQPNFEMLESAFKRFVDVDGKLNATIMPLPTQVTHGPQVNEDLVRHYDQYSIADRIAEVRAKNICSERELAYLIPWIVLSWGNEPSKCSLLELIKWARLGENSFGYLSSKLWFWKFADGQSHFARCLFEEARSSDNLSYSFETLVSKITDRHGHVEVATNKGTWKASKVICTIPITVAAKVQFEPPLSKLRQEAFAVKHVGQGHKIASIFDKSAFRSGVWNVYDERNPPKLAAAFGDQLFENGNTSVVAFGAANSVHELPSQDPTRIKRWMTAIDPEFEEHYKGSIWHEWISDELSEGHWCMSGPGWYTTYLRELQKPHGNVEFASGAAYKITQELRSRPQSSRL
ncbi:hypothetical protein JCM10207_003217 [Rhodosporidiobolus poonsookiae]